jgi:transposase InsO family protein
VHIASRGTYGIRRVHADLTLGHGIAVGQQAVELLMATRGNPRDLRAASLPARPRYGHRRRSRRAAVHRDHPDQLWVTDITEHPSSEGKVYCAVVLDVWSRRVIGWSIHSMPSTALVTNALGMAVDQRRPQGDTLIHSDQGTQFSSWAFMRRAVGFRTAAIDGVGGRLLRQRRRGIVLEPDSGRIRSIARAGAHGWSWHSNSAALGSAKKNTPKPHSNRVKTGVGQVESRPGTRRYVC